MKNFKKAWGLVVQNKRAVASLIGINVINGLVLGIVETLTGLVPDGAVSTILNILMLVAGIALTYITLISSLHILKKCIFQHENMTFSQMYGEFFHYAKENWTKFPGTYAIWNILIPTAIDVAAGAAAFLFLIVLTGGSLIWMAQDLAYYINYYIDYLPGLIIDYLPVAFAALAVMFLICVFAGIFSKAVSYYGVYKISAAQDGKMDFAPVFSDCLTLSAIPILLAAIMSVFLMMFILFGFVVNPILGVIFLFLGFLLSIVAVLALILYNCTAEIKIILDEADRGIGAFKPVFDQPVSPNPDYPDMPALPRS